MSRSFSIEELAAFFEKRTPSSVENFRRYSVLMPLVEKDGETHILFEVRAKHMKHQPGEVCFPGGMIENGETSRECAVRETCEELGVLPEDLEVFCELDSSRNAAGATVYRFLGRVIPEALTRITLSKDEVDTIFTVPLRFFLENDPEVATVKLGPTEDYSALYRRQGLGDYRWGFTSTRLPFYHYPDCPVPIWGLTGRMLENFVKLLRENTDI